MSNWRINKSEEENNFVGLDYMIIIPETKNWVKTAISLLQSLLICI